MRIGRYLWGMLALLLCGALAVACGKSNGGADGQKSSQVSLALKVEQTASGETVSIHAGNSSDLHQLSCRIAYNPRALRFVDAERGDLVNSHAVFFITSKGEAYVPVAFTYHPGEVIPGASGDIAQLHFEVIDASADHGLHIVGDSGVLIARDAQRQDLPVKLEAAR
jgi:hypothetical protein